ncbi:MAG: hypothetical protein JWP35_4028 [Caulobacter sp.]|nr:hypothetical protein [Caulobacter sp.]
MRDGLRLVVLAAMAFLVLDACSPSPNSKAKEAVTAAAPPEKLVAPQADVLDKLARAVLDAPRSWQPMTGMAAAWPDLTNPKVVVRCDERRRLLLVVFPTDPADQVVSHETLSVVSARMTLLADMHFRSPEDVAADDPPAWAELAAFPPTRMVLAGDQPLRFERSDTRHPAISTPAPNAALRKIIEGCR